MENNDSRIKSIQELIEKADQMKKQEKMDLSSDQDLTIAIMNLISIEEHLFCTGAKTGKTQYYDWINDVREIRKNLLKKIITEYEGEVWCISKHLLAASMRVMEVGTKQLSQGNKEQAYELFDKAFDLYSLFWALNMKLVSPDNLKKIDEQAIDKKDTKKSVMSSFGDLVKRIVNCCIE
jgi:hypothetical protein